MAHTKSNLIKNLFLIFYQQSTITFFIHFFLIVRQINLVFGLHGLHKANKCHFSKVIWLLWYLHPKLLDVIANKKARCSNTKWICKNNWVCKKNLYQRWSLILFVLECISVCHFHFMWPSDRPKNTDHQSHKVIPRNYTFGSFFVMVLGHSNIFKRVLRFEKKVPKCKFVYQGIFLFWKDFFGLGYRKIVSTATTYFLPLQLLTKWKRPT